MHELDKTGLEAAGQCSKLVQALSRLAGNRHSDGVSSLVSSEDREAIIEGCHDLMIASRQVKAATTTAAAIKAAFLEGRRGWVPASLPPERGEKEWTESQAFAALSTTSAGVTEEQVEAACAKYAWARYGGTVVWPRDFSPKEISEGRENMRAAIAASRVAPVSQKEAGPVVAAKVKPLDLSALLRDAFLAGRGLKDGDRLSDDDHTAWCAYDPERMNAYIRICAALYASPAPVSAPVGDLKLSEEDLDTINVCAWNEQTGRVTRYEMRELIRVYRAALRSPAVGEVSPNA